MIQGKCGDRRRNHPTTSRRPRPPDERRGHRRETMTFTTVVGVVRDRSVYFIYENLHGESGIIRGHIPNDTPKALTLVYTDLIGSDRNDDPTGTLMLTRRQ